MWELPLPVQGCCPECGKDLSCTITIRATREWIARYHTESRLAEGINRSIERIVTQRHAHVCLAHRQRSSYAAIA
jgi:hypothetical protein